MRALIVHSVLLVVGAGLIAADRAAPAVVNLLVDTQVRPLTIQTQTPRYIHRSAAMCNNASIHMVQSSSDTA